MVTAFKQTTQLQFCRKKGGLNNELGSKQLPGSFSTLSLPKRIKSTNSTCPCIEQMPLGMYVDLKLTSCNDIMSANCGLMAI